MVIVIEKTLFILHHNFLAFSEQFSNNIKEKKTLLKRKSKTKMICLSFICNSLFDWLTGWIIGRVIAKQKRNSARKSRIIVVHRRSWLSLHGYGILVDASYYKYL